MKIKIGRYAITAIFSITKHPEWMLECIEHIKTGQTLLAVKVFKDHTGYSLLDARNFVVDMKNGWDTNKKINIPLYKTYI